jgi:hypothetical protein
MRYKKNKRNKNRLKNYDLDSIIRRDFLSMKKQWIRKDTILLDSGFYDSETWGALIKCWIGYKIAKSEHDIKKMIYYAKGIRKFQRELMKTESDFPQLGLVGPRTLQEVDSMSDRCDRFRYSEMEELEKLEMQQQQQRDPFRIEREPDPRKTQEEYFRRILQESLDPGSYV